MDSGKPLVYVVVENPYSKDCRVKAVFETKEAAEEAIQEKFINSENYEIEARTLLESITD